MPQPPVGHLLCVGVRGATPDDPALRYDLDQCRQEGVGGVILFDVDLSARHARSVGSPEPADGDAPRNIISHDQLRALTDFIRERLGRHALVAVDQEGGRVARLNKRRGFEPGPAAIEFAALPLAARLADADRQAAQLSSAGVTVNLAPCVDLLIDPRSAVIARAGRAFGEDPGEVIENARIVLDAHARHGVLTCLKHFPGHGSAAGDTHEGLVDITATHRDDEVRPYRELLDKAAPAPAVMVAHVLHRGLDPSLPASLSPEVITGLLRRRLGFDGVVVTDSIDMGAVTRRWSPAEAVVMAVRAGADLVVDGFNAEAPRPSHPAPELARALREAVADGTIDPARIDQSLARLARWAGSATNA